MEQSVQPRLLTISLGLITLIAISALAPFLKQSGPEEWQSDKHLELMEVGMALYKLYAVISSQTAQTTA
eukprot:2983907-Amphidinium_carterae.1